MSNDNIFGSSAERIYEQQRSEEYGRLQALLGSAVLRMDDLERRFLSLEAKLIEVLAVVSRISIVHIFAAVMFGTFGGVSGALAVTHYVLAANGLR